MILSCDNDGIYCALQMSHTKCIQMELQCQIAGEEDPSQHFFKQTFHLFSFSVGKNMEKSEDSLK